MQTLVASVEQNRTGNTNSSEKMFLVINTHNKWVKLALYIPSRPTKITND